MKKRIVALTGAGISAESGISTFRDSGGLWEQHRIEDVATPEAWRRNPELVLRFYNERRKKLFDVSPNAGHLALAALENDFTVDVVTQNVDDLHERAGSSQVLHLHGELRKVRSDLHPKLIYDWDKDLHWGDLCERGAQLRPHIVWFGEAVPMIEPAADLSYEADIFLIIGTSLQVYPAAGLMQYTRPDVPIYYIDPNASKDAVYGKGKNIHIVKEPATTGVPKVVEMILRK